jgi:adenylylsulfate reductase subunit A
VGVANQKITALSADCLVIGGGVAGCTAANLLGSRGFSVIVAEKANITRSGCLAAGVNAINAWVGYGKTPEDYAQYALKDAHGIGSLSLLRTMSEKLSSAIEMLEDLGLVFHKGQDGLYKSRSWRNLKVNGENIKPLLSKPLRSMESVKVVENVHVINLILSDSSEVPAVAGALGINTRENGGFYLFDAKAVIIATGGAAGLYRPNNQGISSHKMWYPPFNTGGGYAMGILIGAELSTLEMRFVALRCKDTMAPTGTLSLGVNAVLVNAFGEAYESRYGNSTSERVLAQRMESEEGRGPSALVARNLSDNALEELSKAYFHMNPLQSLRFLEEASSKDDSGKSSSDTFGKNSYGVYIEGSEPYVIGGHTASGYVINASRETTIKGLYAAGDVAFGSPQKYVSGSMAEAILASTSVSQYLKDGEKLRPDSKIIEKALKFASQGLFKKSSYNSFDLEEAMQKTMDTLAGGRGASYRYSISSLKEAKREIDRLYKLSHNICYKTFKDLSRIFELRERLVLSFSLLTHLMNRRETRWRGFGEYFDYPDVDPRYELFLNSRTEAYGGCYPEKGLKNVILSARSLHSLEEIPLPDPQEDPPQ